MKLNNYYENFIIKLKQKIFTKMMLKKQEAQYFKNNLNFQQFIENFFWDTNVIIFTKYKDSLVKEYNIKINLLKRDKNNKKLNNTLSKLATYIVKKKV